jgi:COMPASS component SWD2
MRYVSTHDNSFLRYFKGHTDTVTSISLSPASDQFISCSKDNTVRLWNLQSNNYFGLLNLHAPHLAVYDPSATVIAVASPPTHSVLLYDVRNFDKPPFAAFDLLEASQRFLGPSSTAEWTKIEFTNDGKSLVVSTTGSGHFVLDAFEGNVVHFCYRKAGHSGRPAPGSSVFNGVKAPLGQGDTCVSPDGQYLIGGSSEEGLLVWDISKPATSNNYLEPVETLPGTGKAAVVGYNPRSNLIASGDKDFFLWQPDADLLM